MDDKWFLDCTLAEFVADEVGTSPRVAQGIVDLFDKGNEVAYVARYRVDVHKGLSCEQIRQAFYSYNDGKELNKKVEKAVNTVTAKSTSKYEKEAAIAQLKQSREPSDVLEVTKIFSTGKKTKADKARALGIGDAAERILHGEIVNINGLVDNKKPELSTTVGVHDQLQILISDLLNRLPETVDICKKIARLDGNVHATVKCDLSSKAKKWKEGDDNYSLITHFSTYLAFEKPARYIQNFQILAMDRGEEKDVLSWNVVFNNLERLHPGNSMRVAEPHIGLFRSALAYTIQHQFTTRIQRAAKRFLLRKAEFAAIDCFSGNLSQLFSLSPLNGVHVVALDPGYAKCKCAFLSPEGEVIETSSFGLNGKAFDNKGETLLAKWAKIASRRLVIAIGNGKASLETQKAVAYLIHKKHFGSCDVKFCVVSECGASKYSITPLAEEELPGIPITEKSAVSIGRRLIDPLSEYVKIEPKHLGLGMYQHSVNEKKLSEALNLVVRDCVSLRGVDVNVASLQLLQHICGLNKRTAAGILEMRSKGRISSREQLKKVKGLGQKSFEQCAGFLRIVKHDGPDEPPKKKKKGDSEFIHYLDSTTVHPKDYDIAQRLFSRLGISSPDDINSKSGHEKLKSAKVSSEERLIVQLLTESASLTPPPPLLTEVRKLASLREGEKFLGRVGNKVDFGIFVDIGAEKDALAHASCLQKPFPEVGSQLWVVVTSIDTKRQRISVKPLDN